MLYIVQIIKRPERGKFNVECIRHVCNKKCINTVYLIYGHTSDLVVTNF